jgi:hypothetical protein
MNDDISVDEITVVIGNLRKGKAVGIDELPA